MFDPPRAEVADAVPRCHEAGIRIIVITGDHGLTAAAIARRVGIARDGPTIVTGEELDGMSEDELDALLREGRELIFARSSPEAKLRIADALRAEGHVVAMTGDGVNDAPALRRADIGVAMGRSGTDVAREASTMVLTDDNFATIVAAVEAGRRVYDNIRKFILYIFAHTTPEVTPFLVFALERRRDPAAAHGPAAAGLRRRHRDPAGAGARAASPPSPASWSGRRASARRASSSRRCCCAPGCSSGVICAVLAMAGFFYVLLKAGWSPGDPTGEGDPLHHAYQQATTMTFLGMVAGQIGTAFAARTDRASLRSVGVLQQPPAAVGHRLRAGPRGHSSSTCRRSSRLLGTAALDPDMLLFVAPFPFIVWGADELRRWLLRRHEARGPRSSRSRVRRAGR